MGIVRGVEAAAKSARELGSEARQVPPPEVGSVRIGAGAGFAGDRVDPALELAEFGHCDYLVFELLGERTVANAQQRKLADPADGYDPSLLERIRLVAPHCARAGTTIITNGGAANPLAAGEAVVELLAQLGLDLTVAVVTGDDVVRLVRSLDPIIWETGEPVSRLPGHLVSANAYLGAAGIKRALEAGADVVITGRVADPSLYVGALAHSFGWDLEKNLELVGRATVLGHLLECAGQLTGGYFADPESKPVAGLDRLGFPYADVDASANAVFSTLPGTGGAVTVRTCTEQLLYEVADPGAYITPDVIADFTQVRFTQVAAGRVRVDWKAGGRVGRGVPETLKVSVGYLEGWEGEGQITYAGARAMARAQWAAEIVVQRLRRLHGFDESEVSVEYIGAGGSFRGLGGAGEGLGAEPVEVRLRVVGRAESAEDAEMVGREVEALYTNGPAGGGGARMGRREILAVKSCSVSRELVSVQVASVQVVDLSSDVDLFSDPANREPCKEPAASALDGTREGDDAGGERANDGTDTADTWAEDTDGVTWAENTRAADTDAVTRAVDARAADTGAVVIHGRKVDDIATVRTGDKGDTLIIAVVAREGAVFADLERGITARAVAAQFGMTAGEVRRTLLPVLGAMSFELPGVLGGGVTGLGVLDGHGKTLSYHLLNMRLEGK